MKKYLLEYPTILERLKEVSPEDNGEEWFNNTCMFIDSIIQTEVDIALAKAKTSESVEHKGCIKRYSDTPKGGLTLKDILEKSLENEEPVGISVVVINHD